MYGPLPGGSGRYLRCVCCVDAGVLQDHCIGVWLLSLWQRKMLYGNMDGRPHSWTREVDYDRCRSRELSSQEGVICPGTGQEISESGGRSLADKTRAHGEMHVTCEHVLAHSPHLGSRHPASCLRPSLFGGAVRSCANHSTLRGRGCGVFRLALGLGDPM